MARSSLDPRERVAGNAGHGEFGNDFGTYDREFQEIKMKLPRVRDGQDELSNREMQLLLALLFVGR